MTTASKANVSKAGERKARIAKSIEDKKADELNVGTSEPILISLYEDLLEMEADRLKKLVKLRENGIMSSSECIRKMCRIL